MNGLLLRLAGPLQGWGERGSFRDKDTLDFPTRSGLLGLIACAAGIPRGGKLGTLTELDFVVRIDRPGVRVIDFHTVGGNYPHRGIPTAEGKRRKDAIITRRHYLSDAAFTVACIGPDEAIDAAHEALRQPCWQPFLGRRSCPPEQPMMLGIMDDFESALREIPLQRRKPFADGEVPVEFVRTAHAGAVEGWTEVLDDCDSFPLSNRHYRPRTVARTKERLDAELCKGTGMPYLDALAEYLSGGRS